MLRGPGILFLWGPTGQVASRPVGQSATVPNVIDPESITDNMGVCDLHWPPGTPMTKNNQWLVPAIPPSISVGIPASFQRQTIPKNRSISSTQVSSTALKPNVATVAEQVIDPDLIPN